MKIVLLVLGAVVVLVAIVVVVGLLLPKSHAASRSAAFRTTPGQLFNLIAGPQSWRPDLLRSEPVADAQGRDLVRETTRNGETITYEILDRTPPTSVTRRIATENLPYSGTWTFSLQPASGETIVRITEHGEVYNPIFRFVSRFVIGHTSTIDAYLNALAKATNQTIQIQD
jgi:hypothetical protein